MEKYQKTDTYKKFIEKQLRDESIVEEEKLSSNKDEQPMEEEENDMVRIFIAVYDDF